MLGGEQRRKATPLKPDGELRRADALGVEKSHHTYTHALINVESGADCSFAANFGAPTKRGESAPRVADRYFR